MIISLQLGIDNNFEALTEAIITGNYLLYVCKYRSTRYLGIGCLGVIEHLFPEASKAMLMACRRLGIKQEEYYATHTDMDIEHAQRWTTNLFDQLEKEGQAAKEEMALGAILRLNLIMSMYDNILKNIHLYQNSTHSYQTKVG